MSKLKRPRLGRGLSSLISDSTYTANGDPVVETVGPAASPLQAASSPDGMRHLPIDTIFPNPYQPRQTFDEGALQQLAESIRGAGVMQPVIVRPKRDGHGFELVAGERRWRAAGKAGLTSIPALVRELDDRQLAEWAVIENLQREDLDPMERANAFARLIEQFGLTHEQVSERVGIERSTVTNTLRLLHLHPDVQEMVRRGHLSAGHARALLSLAGNGDSTLQVELAQRVVKSGWSVRTLEQAVRNLTSPARPAEPPKASTRSAHLADVARQIAEQLHTKVEIRPGREKNSGRLIIDYFGLDQFDELIRRMGVAVE